MIQQLLDSKKILVTGGTGFLGRYFVRLLLTNGYLPILLVRSTPSESAYERVNAHFSLEEMKHIEVWEADLTQLNPGNIPEHWRQTEPIRAMFHIAGLVKFDAELKDLLHSVNIKGTEHALSLAQQLGISHFYYVSTAYTAGNTDVAYEQLHPLTTEFNNPYEESKCIAEHLVLKENSSSFKTTILRPSIIIGDSETGEADTQYSIYGFLRGLSLFKRKAEKHFKHIEKNLYFPLNIKGDPQGLSNLVPINYVAEIMLTALEHECKHQIYHLTNPMAPTKQLLLEVFTELLQVKGMSFVQSMDKMTDWDKKFHQFISVYQPYMQDDPKFSTVHTADLLSEAKKNLLLLQKEDYLRIFRTVFT